MRSKEGWNAIGGLFPGAPMILHGHNEHLGWAHTVNAPDLVDVYRLEMNPSGALEYRFDGKWVPLEVTQAKISLDVWAFDLTLSRDVYASVHGPVMKTDEGWFAIRYAGIGAMIRAIRPLLYDVDIDHDGALTKDPVLAFQRAVAFLVKHYGKVDVPLGELQRLRRGTVDLPIGGGPDVMNAVYTKKVDGHLVGFQGDSYVLEVEFGADGVRSRSLHQYGNSCRPGSPHYADQAPLFVKHELKDSYFREEDLKQNVERSYRPGDPISPAD